MDRRSLLVVGAVSGLGMLTTGCGQAPRVRSPGNGKGGEHKEEDVSPAEDLMREHGVLNRILLVYEECGRRLSGVDPQPVTVLTQAASIIRHFIEDYHEKLEEEFLFPRFEKANELVDLVGTLRKQHQTGRVLTEKIQRLATASTIQEPDAKKNLVSTIDAFVRMYRPHESREDTVLFPALRHVVGREELAELGERFEDKEHELFGKEGFEGIVVQVAQLEQELGIYDLGLFTPT